MTKQEIKTVDDLASKAMQAILSSISNPAMIEIFDKIAEEKKQSVISEIAERSYLMAYAMIKKKDQMIHLTEK